MKKLAFFGSIFAFLQHGYFHVDFGCVYDERPLPLADNAF
jgi:hypothetical protein